VLNLSRIHRLGTNKIEKIVKVLAQVLPEAILLCRAAEVNILNPLISNTPIPRLLANEEAVRDRLSLLEVLSLDHLHSPKVMPDDSIVMNTIRRRLPDRREESPLSMDETHPAASLLLSLSQSGKREGVALMKND
jgi:hypothetical protein